MISLASCKKDYTCVCSTNYDSDKSVTTRDVSNSSKKNAEAICGNSTEVYTYTYTNNGVTVVDSETYLTTCELK
ncbi:hypothetical protein CNR22_13745 [Sphingobacteriaceae bacterium]|nr:hypothetical protein CNR22_13745 [Sphingobacteriaceae bacterium]